VSRLFATDFSLGWDDTLLRLALAALLGAAIGLERELDEKAAGLRTHMLVASGSALFTLVSAYGFSGILSHSGANVLVRLDPSRIAAQIVTGIGFLGAGVIFRQGFTIRGLTTAASLWLVAAIGMAAGAGYWAGAVLATVVGVVSLRPLEWVKNRMLPQRAATVMLVELVDDASSGPVLEAVERSGDLLALRRDGARLEVELRIDRDRRSQALDAVAELDEVEEARWAS
jgi:putative Mg2+ transporter-C (MgtC) family protein